MGKSAHSETFAPLPGPLPTISRSPTLGGNSNPNTPPQKNKKTES